MTDETKMTDTCPNSLLYRPCVGIALFDSNGRVFIGERVDNPGAWQMPQGGIDEGETVEQAAYRELEEETGTRKAAVIKIHDTPLRYHFPDYLQGRLWGGRYCGQEQSWVAMRFTGTDGDIDLAAHAPREFLSWQWTTLDGLADIAVPFKRDVYAKIAEAFREFSRPA